MRRPAASPTDLPFVGESSLSMTTAASPTQVPDVVSTGEAPGTLTPEVLQGLARSFAADAGAVRMQNAVTRAGIDQVAVNRARQVSLSTTMSHRLDNWTVANQKKSGRCWLFAALNLFRFGTRGEQPAAPVLLLVGDGPVVQPVRHRRG